MTAKVRARGKKYVEVDAVKADLPASEVVIDNETQQPVDGRRDSSRRSARHKPSLLSRAVVLVCKVSIYVAVGIAATMAIDWIDSTKDGRSLKDA